MPNRQQPTRIDFRQGGLLDRPWQFPTAATVLPGDIVLTKKTGTVFIPASMVEDLVLSSEFIERKDEFGHMRLRERKYTPGQIDQQWSDEIRKDFLQWLDTKKNLPMSRQELDQYWAQRLPPHWRTRRAST